VSRDLTDNMFGKSAKGGDRLVFNHRRYTKNTIYKDGSMPWRCSHYATKGIMCPGTAESHNGRVRETNQHSTECIEH
jgi:hypothetical protein